MTYLDNKCVLTQNVYIFGSITIVGAVAGNITLPLLVLAIRQKQINDFAC